MTEGQPAGLGREPERGSSFSRRYSAPVGHGYRDGAVVLRDCLVLDGYGGPAVDGEVWILDGRIVEPGSARVCESASLHGRVVAPGLIDAHVHLCLDASPEPLAVLRTTSGSELLRRMRLNARQTLDAGITTVRDVGSPTALITALREEIDGCEIQGPRILASGGPITSPQGHLSEMGVVVEGSVQARQAVRSLVVAGVDFIKAIGSGGGSSPQTDPHACQFSDEVMFALVDEARRAGLPVACHAHADSAIRQAATAGVATIEHGSYASETTLKLMAESGVTLVPTLAPALHAGVLEFLEHAGLASARMTGIRERYLARCDVVRASMQLGVRVIAGSDAGVAGTPHGGIDTEIIALSGCGMPRGTAMSAAWFHAACALGIPNLGVIRPGAHADLIVLESDPLHDLSVLGRPLAVMKAGRWVRQAHCLNRGSR